MKGDFTSVSDIGKIFNGHIVQAEDYIRIEDAYVECVMKLMTIASIDVLEVIDFEDKINNSEVDPLVSTLRPIDWSGTSVGCELMPEQVDSAVRLTLRELIWCRLAGDKGLYVDFSYEMYMYIGANIHMDWPLTDSDLIYYEPFDSPYRSEGGS